jgi:hypothetical protein
LVWDIKSNETFVMSVWRPKNHLMYLLKGNMRIFRCRLMRRYVRQ